MAARGVYSFTSPGLGALVCCGDGWQWLLLLVGELDELDVEAEGLQFADKYVERLGHTRLDGSFAFDDGFVDLGTAEDVVGLGGEQLLQDVGGAVSFKGPDFHLSEALSAELCLTTKRLLGDERVRSDRASVDLVVDKVRELQHIDVADGGGLLERIAVHAIEELRLARAWEPGCFQQSLDLGLACAVEYRGAEPDAALHAGGNAQSLLVVQVEKLVESGGSGEARLEELADLAGLGEVRSQLGDLLAEFVRGPAKVRLQDLTDVHTRRHAERVQDDLDRGSVGEIRHIFLRKNPGDDTLVTVASGHLVADRELALHRNVDLHHLDDAGSELVALRHLGDLLVGDLAQHVDLARGHLLDLIDLLVDAGILVGVADALEVTGADELDGVAVENVALREQFLVGALVVQVGKNFLVAEDCFETLEALVGENTNLIGEVALELLDHLLLDLLGALVRVLALAGEDADVDDGTFDAWRARQGGIANVAGLLAEDGAEQFLFRRQLSLTLRRYLADEDVVVADLRADADNARFVEIAQSVLADVGDIARDLFRPKLRIAGFDLELLDMDRGVVVLADQLLRDEDRVFEVVTAPRHEGDENVAAEAEFALLRARTVSDDLPLDDAVALTNDRLLVDAGVLVGALELRELVDVRADLTRELRGVVLAFY